MTDHYDEMRVPPDPALAEALRRRLHAHMASAALDDHEGRSHRQFDAARLEPDAHLSPVKEIDRVPRLTHQRKHRTDGD